MGEFQSFCEYKSVDNNNARFLPVDPAVPVPSYLLPVTGFRSPVHCFRCSTAGRLPIADCRLPFADCQLLPANCRLLYLCPLSNVLFFSKPLKAYDRSCHRSPKCRHQPGGKSETHSSISSPKNGGAFYFYGSCRTDCGDATDSLDTGR